MCFRSIMLYEFKKGENAAQCSRNICEIFGKESTSERTCQFWYKKFRSGDFDLIDKPRSGRPLAFNDEVLKLLIDENPRITTREVAERFNVDHTTVLNHLHGLKMVSRLDVWVPHKLSEKNLIDRFTACTSLLARQKEEPFLDRIVTGDEKWVLYDNQVRKRHWSVKGETPLTTPKAGLTTKKVMLCCWWDCQGLLYYELLKYGETVNSERYCEQLVKLSDALKLKRPYLVNRKGVIFHQDNARPHVSIMTQQKLNELGWEILTHPPYSPDIAPSDYYLFRSLQNHLNGKKMESFDAVKKCVDDFFDSKPAEFYEKGINKLTERWNDVVCNQGNYVID